MSASAQDVAGLEAFIVEWRKPLETAAKVAFHCAQRSEDFAAPHVTADRFVELLSYKPIGFAWEMLDAADDAGGPRSAMQVIGDALATNMDASKREWLGQERAKACASQFVELFDPISRTVLSNRYDGLWHPISGAQVEWAFVGFDEHKIALLLLSEQR